MTYIDDSRASQGGDEPNYPVVFGQTLTPKVQGIALGVLGLGTALYLFLNMIMPAQEENNKLLQDKAAKQTQIDQLKSGEAQKKIQQIQNDLSKEKNLQQQTLGMFSDNKTIDVLLFDLNNIMTARQGLLTSYVYDVASNQEVINDGSLGAAVNGKLKRQRVKLNLQGSFEQTKAFLQEVEKLQPLLLIKNLTTQSNVSNVYRLENNQLVPDVTPKLTTSFDIETILPLEPTPPPAAAPGTQPGQPGQPAPSAKP